MQDNNKRSTKPWCCSYIRLLDCKRFALGKETATSDLAMWCKQNACCSTMLKKLSVHMRLNHRRKFCLSVCCLLMKRTNEVNPVKTSSFIDLRKMFNLWENVNWFKINICVTPELHFVNYYYWLVGSHTICSLGKKKITNNYWNTLWGDPAMHQASIPLLYLFLSPHEPMIHRSTLSSHAYPKSTEVPELPSSGSAKMGEVLAGCRWCLETEYAKGRCESMMEIKSVNHKSRC